MRRSSVRTLQCAALYLLLATGCTVGPSSIELPADHPASPEAPSGFVLDVPDVLTPRPDAPRAAERHAGAPREPTPRPGHGGMHHGATEPGAATTEPGVLSARSDGADAVNQQDVDGLFRSYLALSAELARDDVSNASERLSAVREAAKKIAASGDSVTARRAGRVAAAVPDRVGAIADLREGFKSLSAAVTELLASARPGPSVTPTIRRVRCPMAKASWLQTGEAVTNPYYGSEMLRCGSIEETFDLRGER